MGVDSLLRSYIWGQGWREMSSGPDWTPELICFRELRAGSLESEISVLRGCCVIRVSCLSWERWIDRNSKCRLLQTQQSSCLSLLSWDPPWPSVIAESPWCSVFWALFYLFTFKGKSLFALLSSRSHSNEVSQGRNSVGVKVCLQNGLEWVLVHSFLLYVGYQCHLKEKRNMAEVAGGSRALIHVSVALWVALNSQLEDWILVVCLFVQTD